MSRVLFSKDLIKEMRDTGIVDSDEELSLYTCYKHNDKTETNYKNCRGIIFDNNDNLVLQGFPFCHEYVDGENLQELEELLKNKTPQVFNSQEGTLLRVFFHKKWYISTHNKLDAFESKWGNTSFGNRFVDCLSAMGNSKNLFNKDLPILPQFLDTLNKDCKYMFFVLSSHDNNIVCKGHSNEVYHVGTFDSQHNPISVSTVFEKPQEMSGDTSDYDVLVNYVANIDITKYQGLLLIFDDRHVKLYNNEYYRLMKIRGNQPNLSIRYLELRNTDKLEDFKKLLPHPEIFDIYENCIAKIAKDLHLIYLKRYVFKNRELIIVSKTKHIVLIKCHKWHNENRQTNIVNLEKIKSELDCLEPFYLYELIKDDMK